MSWTLLALCLTSCNNDDEEPASVAEEDLPITTLRLSLMQIGNPDTIFLTYQDLDGNGGNAPILTGATLEANSLYFGEVEILDENANPATDLSAEVNADPTDYQFFFVANGVELSFTYADQDGEGLPIGLFTAINTGESSTGTLSISLKKGLNKASPGVPDGDLLNAGGKTQVQANFPLEVK